MDLHTKLTDWQRAELITAAQVEAILAHEQREARPILFYALGGLGAFAVAVGLVSLVAANWDAISPTVKLSLDLILTLGLALGIWRADATRSRFGREVLLLVFFGQILASIGLITQIYQKGGKAQDALLLWVVITAPAMLMLRTGFATTAWLLFVEGTWLWKASDWVVSVLAQGHRETFWLMATVTYLTCLGLAAVGGIPAVRRQRPELAQAAAGLGAVQLVIAASLGQQTWYGHFGSQELASISPLWAAAVVLGSLAAAVGVLSLAARGADGTDADPATIWGSGFFFSTPRCRPRFQS